MIAFALALHLLCIGAFCRAVTARELALRYIPQPPWQGLPLRGLVRPGFPHFVCLILLFITAGNMLLVPW